MKDSRIIHRRFQGPANSGNGSYACGPDRAANDGLRIFPGPVLQRSIVAALEHVVIGWELEREGRKHHTGTALFEAAGICGMDTARIYADQEEYARIGQMLYDQKSEKKILDFDTSFVRKDGTVFEGFVRINLIDSDDAQQGVIASIVDITARKQAEEALRKSEARYRTIYENSGAATLTIQADTTIAMVNREYEKLSGLPREQIESKMSWTEFVVPEDLENMVRYHKEHLSAIEAYVRSATDLTKQLLGVARGGKYEIKPTDINHLVASSAKMFGRTKKEIRIHEKLQSDPIIVAVDRKQIEQVLLNLYINAWQAMPEGGNLYLETHLVILDETYCKPYQTEPGAYAKISVTDSGIGMEPSIRQQIFDPFFTTKDKTRGTGLGLASAYGIIKNHGGMITVYSEVGHGTTFNIYLPLSDQDAHQEESEEEGLIEGDETILLIDDEAMILDVGSGLLEKLGYRVISADSGEKAIELIRQADCPVDLIILDLIMPGMDGGETFGRLREVAPELPVIIASGYAMNGKAAGIMSRGANGFIQKPFTILELSKKVRSVIDGV